MALRKKTQKRKTVGLCLEEAIRALTSNARSTSLDVFRNVEDVDDFDPEMEGDSASFLLWSRAANQSLVKGQLKKALPAYWGGTRNDLQLELARAGLTVRLDVDAHSDEDEGTYPETGTLVVSPSSLTEDCDLRRLLSAFAELEKSGFITLPLEGSTLSDAWTESASVANERGVTEEDAGVVFWHDQDHDAFDATGNLSERMHLGWAGNEERLALALATLERHHFSVEKPASKDARIGIRGSAPAPKIETHEAARAAIAATRAKRPAAPKSEAPGVRARIALSSRLPASHLLIGAEVIAVSQAFGGRGLARHYLALYEARTGKLIEQFERNEAGAPTFFIGGLAFGKDGELRFGRYSLLGGDRTKLEVCEWSRAGRALNVLEERILTTRNAASKSMFVATTECAVTALVDEAGVAVRSKTNEAHFARKNGAYPSIAISPDGKRLAWVESGVGLAPLVCVEVATGKVVFDVTPSESGYVTIAVDRLWFTPESDAVMFLRDNLLAVFAGEDHQIWHNFKEDGVKEPKAFVVTPSGNLVVGSSVGSLIAYRWPLSSAGSAPLTRVKVFEKGEVCALAANKDGLIACASSKGQVVVFDEETLFSE